MDVTARFGPGKMRRGHHGCSGLASPEARRIGDPVHSPLTRHVTVKTAVLDDEGFHAIVILEKVTKVRLFDVLDVLLQRLPLGSLRDARRR